ncbi:MAG: S1 family peptidase [Polyangiales bacterium]
MRVIGSSFVLAAMLGAAVVGCGDAASQREEPVLTRGQAIQGGTVDTGDPAVVGIIINAGGGIAICTGSLIAPNLVLTAHHCVASSGSTSCSSSSFGGMYSASAFRVTTNYNKAASSFSTGSVPSVDGSTWFGVTKVLTPGNNICGQDMAVLELSKPITGVCPLIPAVDVAPTKGEGYTAVGFGITSPSGMAAGTRYKATGLTVQCTSASSCGESTSSMSSTMEWEGGSSGGKGTCEGDSGGPALDSAGRVIGTVSRGPAGSCSSTIYESVYGEAAWIKSVAQTAATDGGYTAAGWITGGATSDVNNGYCGTGTPTGGTDAGTGGGTDSGGGTGTSGGPCPSGLTCTDGSGMGDYGCFDPSSSDGFPSSAPSCTKDADCPSGWNCWAASATATTGSCIEACTPGSTTGADSGTGTGGSTTDSGMGTGGSTTDSGTVVIGGDDAGTGTVGGDGGTTDGGMKKKGVPFTDTGAAGTCAVSNVGGSSESALAGVFALAAALLVARRRR